MTSTEIAEQDIAALIARWSEAAQLYMDGDLRGYAAIARHAEDYTLLPPYGGDARLPSCKKVRSSVGRVTSDAMSVASRAAGIARVGAAPAVPGQVVRVYRSVAARAQ